MDKKQILYLGDGAYVEYTKGGEFMLYTSNGIQITNTIYLEPAVMESLYKFFKKCIEVNK